LQLRRLLGLFDSQKSPYPHLRLLPICIIVCIFLPILNHYFHFVNISSRRNVARLWVEMLIVFVITDYLKVGLYKRLIRKGEVGMGISSQAEISR
jgi:hypothetical protein